MSQELAIDILSVVTLYFIYRSWRYNIGHIGPLARRKMEKMKNDCIPIVAQKVIREQMKKESERNKIIFQQKLRSMFKPHQSKKFTSFMKDLYDSRDDVLQQLYFFLSLSFINKKHFIQLVNSWKIWKLSHSEGIAKYCRDAYYHAKQCGKHGVLSAKDFVSNKRLKLNYKFEKIREFKNRHAIQSLDFSTMDIQEKDVPFIEFFEEGLRYCSIEINECIDETFFATWFKYHYYLDITPATIWFVCLISELIPHIAAKFLNAPFQAKIAQQIYPKIWKLWREQKIEELLFIGSNNWTSTQCNNPQPDWFKKSWKIMQPYVKSGDVVIKYIRGNFIEGTTDEIIDGKGKCCCVIHCRSLSSNVKKNNSS